MINEEDLKEVNEELKELLKKFVKPEFNNEKQKKVLNLLGENEQISKKIISIVKLNKEVNRLREEILNNKKAIIFLLKDEVI